MPYHKYHNKKVQFDGYTFDSRKECERYIVLRDLQKRGDIAGLELQKKFVLLPAQRAPDTVNAKGKPVKGKVLFREISYYADFCYYDSKRDEFVVEDVKGFRTPVYKLKKAMMYYFHGIMIKEV